MQASRDCGNSTSPAEAKLPAREFPRNFFTRSGQVWWSRIVQSFKASVRATWVLSSLRYETRHNKDIGELREFEMRLIQLFPRWSCCLVILTCGCDSFRSRDSLFNATPRYWTVTTQFTSDPSQTYEHAPKTGVGFTSQGRGLELPTLVSITARSASDGIEHRLNSDELLKLRRKAGDELRLVLFDEGFGMITHDLTKKLARTQAHNVFNEVLVDNKSRCLEFTQECLQKP